MLAKPEPSQAKFIWAGYTFAILGGFWALRWVGVFIFPKKIAQRKVVYSYSEEDRKHGKRIITIGFVMMFLLIVLKVLSHYGE
jgi:uncharacterized membrane protein YdjX (TVP38/TMEM64 family)